MQLTNDNSSRVLRLKNVCDRTGLSRSSIYLKMSQNEFPKPIRLGKRSVGWLEADIQVWIAARIQHSAGLHLSANSVQQGESA